MAEQRRPRHQATEVQNVQTEPKNVMLQQMQSAPAAPRQQPMDDAVTIDLQELFFRLLGHWKLIVCLVLLGAVAMGLYTQFFVTPMYQATSIIYVLGRKDSAINLAELQIGNALTADYVKVFNMWEVHEEVISNLDLPYNYAQMRDMLSVTNASDTRMLDISIKSPNPQEAASIANEYATVVSKYIEETMSTDRPNIMSVARVPANPVSPNKVRNVMLGGMLGGVLAAGLVVVQMLMDDKIRTAEEIRRYTGLPNLAVVPVEDGSNPTKREEKHA